MGRTTTVPAAAAAATSRPLLLLPLPAVQSLSAKQCCSCGSGIDTVPAVAGMLNEPCAPPADPGPVTA
jgi:hypothetical protein